MNCSGGKWLTNTRSTENHVSCGERLYWAEASGLSQGLKIAMRDDSIHTLNLGAPNISNEYIIEKATTHTHTHS